MNVRDIISTLCHYKDVKIITGAMYEDCIQISEMILLKLSIIYFVQYLKRKSTLMTYDRHLEL